MSDEGSSYQDESHSVSVKPSPGHVLVTNDRVPLRFVVLGHRQDTMKLYCTARNGVLQVNRKEFFDVEDVRVEKMSHQEISERINHQSAEIAQSVFKGSEL